MVDLVDHMEGRINSHNTYRVAIASAISALGQKIVTLFYARNRHSRFGIDGMRIFFTVDNDEFFIISRSCNRHICNIHIRKRLFCVIGIGNSHSPGFPSA